MKLSINVAGDLKVLTPSDLGNKDLKLSFQDLGGVLSQIDMDSDETESLLKSLREPFDEWDDEEFPVDCDDDDKIIMLLTPGKRPRVMKAWEACELLPCFYEKYECIEDFNRMYSVNLYYQKDQIMPVGNEKFLIGPALVCCVDDNAKIRSLTGAEIYQINRYVEHHEKRLSGDGKDFPALQLPQ